MARKIRSDSTFGGLLERAGIPKEQQNKVLKSPTGRKVRSDIQIGTMRKRANETKDK